MPGSFIVTSCLHFCYFHWRCCIWFHVVMEQKKQHESVLCFWACSVYCTLKIPLCCIDTRPDVFIWHFQMLASGALHMERSSLGMLKAFSCVTHTRALIKTCKNVEMLKLQNNQIFIKVRNSFLTLRGHVCGEHHTLMMTNMFHTCTAVVSLRLQHNKQ